MTLLVLADHDGPARPVECLLALVLAFWGQCLSSLYYTFAAGFLLLAIGLGRVLLRPRTISGRVLSDPGCSPGSPIDVAQRAEFLA